jgi:hypothetical protein
LAAENAETAAAAARRRRQQQEREDEPPRAQQDRETLSALLQVSERFQALLPVEHTLCVCVYDVSYMEGGCLLQADAEFGSA